MSIIEPRVARLHHFYRSVQMPCPYLPDRVERKLFTRLSGVDALTLNSLLSQAGFRRSHDIIYRPVCAGCQECVPVRIPAERFVASRSMRRVRRQNADLLIVDQPAVATGEQFALFRRYQQSRHGDSDMAKMTRREYAAMIEECTLSSQIYELRHRDGGHDLVGAILADRLSDGVSAVYSFFDPDEARRSLGTQLVLSLVELTLRLGLQYVYLGYWVGQSRKMAYKARFRPLEALGPEGWAELPAPSAERPSVV